MRAQRFLLGSIATLAFVAVISGCGGQAIASKIADYTGTPRNGVNSCRAIGSMVSSLTGNRITVYECSVFNPDSAGGGYWDTGCCWGVSGKTVEPAPRP
jgi:hypothetical protein